MLDVNFEQDTNGDIKSEWGKSIILKYPKAVFMIERETNCGVD